MRTQRRPLAVLLACGVILGSFLPVFASGVVFTVEFSDTLAPTSRSNALVTQSVLTDIGTIQTVKATVPVGPTIPKLYARLKATQAP